jgi:hypothetical protein
MYRAKGGNHRSWPPKMTTRKSPQNIFSLFFNSFACSFWGIVDHPCSWVPDWISFLHQSHRVAEMFSRATPTFRAGLGPDLGAEPPNLEA